MALATSLTVAMPHASAQPAWTQATEVSPPSGANATPAAQFNGISCVAAGSCTAVGSYQDSLSHQQAMAAAETSGTWGQATAVTAPTTAGANPTASLVGVSCSSAGNCVAAGTFVNASAHQEDMVTTETAGTWAQATVVSLPADAAATSAATLGGIACTSAGNCTIVGSYTDTSGHGQAMVATETSGTWAQATKITPPANASTTPPGAKLGGISCYSAGNCTAAGSYVDTSNFIQAMTATETSGTWAQASEVSSPAYAYPDISCTSAGNCVTGGQAVDGSGNLQGAIATESLNSWGQPTLIPAPADAAGNPHATINDVSCASLGNCLAVGTYQTTGGATDAMVAVETDNTWAPAKAVLAPVNAAANPGASLTGVSCSSTVDCAAAGTYSATGSGSEAMVAMQVPPMPYSPLSPTRICDTRPGNPSSLSGNAAQCNGPGNTGKTMAAGSTLTIDVAGLFTVPADAGAVVLNVTIANPTGAGFLTVFPAGQSLPFASNLNYTAQQTVPNLVEVGLGPSGQVSLYTTTQTDVVVDLEGYTAPSASGAGLYNPLTPARVCDTRVQSSTVPANECNGSGPETLGPGQTKDVQVTGVGPVPAAGVEAVVLNVTVVNPVSIGDVTVFPADKPMPNSSNINYVGGQVIPNRVIVPVSASGQVALYTTTQTDLIVDVSGWYSTSGGAGTQFVAESAPVRICDTRPNNPSGLSGPNAQCNSVGALGSNSFLTIHGAGFFGVPTTAKAVVLNVTAVYPTDYTFLTVYPSGTSPPLVSDLNPPPNGVEPNLVVATLSGSGTFNVFNDNGTVNLVIDLAGWYS